LHKKKAEEYGNTYHVHGDIMNTMFPNGLCLESKSDFTRFANFNMIVGKVCRYSNNFCAGGHDDSLDDLSVYAMIQKEVDGE
jgi:hypothetical protein